MQRRIFFYIIVLILWGLLSLMLTGCKPGASTPAQTSAAAPETVSPQSTAEIPVPSATPSPTEETLAVRISGWQISLAEYQAELAMFQSASGADLKTEDKKKVLDELVDQALLAQAAVENGFIVNDAILDQRIQQLTVQLGGKDALSSWMSKYQYNENTFRKALERSVAAAWMRDKIAAEVPNSTEQIHARQILLYTSDQAEEIYQQLLAGNSFRNLALKYDPLTGGDLGWFPRGYLPASQIEDAVFDLQPEAYSPVIESPAGFHIVQVLERDPARQLSPDALLVLQTRAVEDWLELRRSQSEIEVIAP